jgi:hypothetical protein
MEAVTRVTLRIPEDLHERIAAQARKDRRSINSEILHLLERGLDDDPDGSSIPVSLRGKPDSSPA